MADDLEHDEDLEIDFRRLQNSHAKAGYKEGLDLGEESTIQDGFNQGFHDAVCIANSSAKVLGSISAAMSYIASKKTQIYQDLRRDLLELKHRVELLEQNVLEEYTESSVVKVAEFGKTEKDALLLQEEEQCCKKDGFDCSMEGKEVDGHCTDSDDSCCQNTQSTNYTKLKGTPCCQSLQTKSENRTKHLTNSCPQEGNSRLFNIFEKPEAKKSLSNTLDTFDQDIKKIEDEFTSLVKNKILGC